MGPSVGASGPNVHVGSSGEHIYLGEGGAGVPPAPLKWANFAAGAYAEMSAADTQLVEDVYNASGGDISYLASWEADLSLGGPTTARYPFSFSTSVDTNGTTMALARHTNGRINLFFWDDAGGTVADGFGPAGVDTLFQGDEDFCQWWDFATGTTGAIQMQAPGSIIDDIDTSYDRTKVGVFDRFAVSGWTRGPVPTVASILGWTYFTIVVAADTRGIRATVEADVLAASGQLAKYNAAISALVAGGFAAQIIHAQAYYEGSTADYGDDATIVGATYSEAEGVP